MSLNLNLKFANRQQEFFLTLNQRVNAYFKTNQLERTGNSEMVFKTIFMFSLYFIPYFLLISGITTNPWMLLGLCVVMGLGIAGIGLSVMHDANHGAYSSKPWVNNLLGLSLNLVGGHALNWKVQHNVLHHTYTNVHEVDEDISPRGVLRMAPDSKWMPMHKYQHYYAWFFYGLLTLVWVLVKDFGRLIKYQREGLLKKQRTTAAKEWSFMLLTKAIYFGYLIAVPVMLLPITVGQALLGFFVMHYIAGFILAIIFQPAHVVEGTEYPMPDAQGNLENNWAIHQLHTTTNFGHKEKLFSWYVGGLNYQVEHHLFPTICHVHYRNIAKIVEQTAAEFGLPYKSKDTFFQAIAAHARQLKMLGEKPVQKIHKVAIAA
ncbi:MAG: acyl-CoA desaturase [Cyclobacteriaceae bacterium]|nr:acyl-CoA desaturase [Cyclobacteriaceae bacterium]